MRRGDFGPACRGNRPAGGQHVAKAMIGVLVIPVAALVVGAGPAGLAAAGRLARSGAGSVLVVDREPVASGTSLHYRHPGFGMRDQHRLQDGPAYAASCVAQGTSAGAVMWTGTTCLDWVGPASILCTGPAGQRVVEARAVVLATGCWERPRRARLVSGKRPPGVITTGSLQRLVALVGPRVGRRAVVVGAERVSFSALLALRSGGVRPVGLVREHARRQAPAPIRRATATRMGVPIWTRPRVIEVHGCERVSGVTLAGLDGSGRRHIACDTVVFTGDFVPDDHLARLGALRLDPVRCSPVIDGDQRTTRPGVFAAATCSTPPRLPPWRRPAGSRVRWRCRRTFAARSGLEPSRSRCGSRRPSSGCPPRACVPHLTRFPTASSCCAVASSGMGAGRGQPGRPPARRAAVPPTRAERVHSPRGRLARGCPRGGWSRHAAARRWL